jgi:UDP-N-acetylmuramoyl-tripeptide--D-alanyl-D-alanine ligase
VRASIATAREMADGLGGRLVLVLGDMLELGELSERLHREMGQSAIDARADVLVTVGDEMKFAADAAHGRVPTVLEAANANDAAKALAPIVKARDVVLVKGSRGMRMEGVIAALVAGHDVEKDAT